MLIYCSHLRLHYLNLKAMHVFKRTVKSKYETPGGKFLWARLSLTEIKKSGITR